MGCYLTKLPTTSELVWLPPLVHPPPPLSADMPVFAMTDPGWPPVMRVHPLLSWSYSQVWDFLQRLNVVYCDLYDRGYVSCTPVDCVYLVVYSCLGYVCKWLAICWDVCAYIHIYSPVYIISQSALPGPLCRYTSVGHRRNTQPNPLLCNPSSPHGYDPAHMLRDPSAERHGRMAPPGT